MEHFGLDAKDLKYDILVVKIRCSHEFDKLEDYFNNLSIEELEDMCSRHIVCLSEFSLPGEDNAHTFKHALKRHVLSRKDRTMSDEEIDELYKHIAQEEDTMTVLHMCDVLRHHLI